VAVKVAAAVELLVGGKPDEQFEAVAGNSRPTADPRSGPDSSP
jgi:hypothetical protein